MGRERERGRERGRERIMWKESKEKLDRCECTKKKKLYDFAVMHN